HLGDCRMGGDHILQLARADVLALADDDVLPPARDAEPAGVVECTEITGAEPSVGRGRLGAVEVTDEALRAAREDLALASRADVGTVVVDAADLVRAAR